MLDPIEFPAGLVCELPVRIEAEANRSAMKVFPNGRLLFTGFLWTRVTNLDTGRSISFNNSGAATLTPNADGSLTVEGRGQLLFFFFFFFFFFPEDLGGARLLRTTGQIRETFRRRHLSPRSATAGAWRRNSARRSSRGDDQLRAISALRFLGPSRG